MSKSALKLAELMKVEGFTDSLDFLEHCSMDSVCPGICTRKDCDYTTEVEPDCCDNYCEKCKKQSVKSALVLMGVI